MNQNVVILPITPQTKVDVTERSRLVFIIPETCMSRHRVTGKEEDKGKPCDEFLSGNIYCGHTLNKQGHYKKRRIQQYNDYKASVAALAKKAGFYLPMYGFSIYFYIPIPRKWTNADRKIMHGQPHHRKPDIDNFLKAVFDSLSLTDEMIAQLSGLGKFWVDTKQGSAAKSPIGPGWIEIRQNEPVYNPFGVEFIDQTKVASLSQTADYKKRKKEGSVRKHTKKNKPVVRRRDELK